MRGDVSLFQESSLLTEVKENGWRTLDREAFLQVFRDLQVRESYRACLLRVDKEARRDVVPLSFL